MVTASPVQKFRVLTRALLARTKAGDIAWEGTSLGNVYSTRIGSSNVHLENSSGDIIIKIYNDVGVLADAFSDVTISDEAPTDYDSWYELMRDLFAIASRQVTGADKVLDDVLKNLGIE